ncbi:MAG: PD-(D/E)XK nuclease family protein [Bacteroidales bacterium]|nr:PD-(D/E)XK nuclease family protein [Bacteroidales bacterium]
MTEVYDKPFFLPVCYSIDDFLTSFAPYETASPEEQLMLLYRLYAEHNTDRDPLIKFAPQAKMILQDFNEIDLELVDAEALFTNLSNIQELSFWNPGNKPLSDFQELQIKFFKQLYNYYIQFKEILHTEQLSYQGDIYRYVAEHVEEIFKNSPYKKIVFIGFNALSKSEKTIIKHLKDKQLLDFIVDADTFYTNNPNHEAGKFIREIQNELFPNQALNFIGTYFENTETEKKINIQSVGTPILQAKILPQILENLQGSTVVVPNDESLLPALLHSYDWSKANITMSYNIKKTLICQLFDTIFSIVENQEILQKHDICYANDIHAFFDNGIVYNMSDDPSKSKTAKIFYTREDFLSFFDTTYSNFAELCGQLFFDNLNNVDFLKKLQELVQLLLLQSQENNIKFDEVDEEILQQFDTYFDKLQALLNAPNDNLVTDKRSLKFMFDNFISTTALSFQSDEKNDLQLMGMLETRTLDFENVILLSVNENILPNNSRSKTFIPYDLRKHFGMQTFDSKDAVSAYHFYRLLQRAKNVFLIYSLEGNDGSAEKSRYILQIEQELANCCTINCTAFNVSFAKKEQEKPIQIPKNEEIITQLGNTTFSASALNTYLSCSLQYYFSKILKIEEIKTNKYITDDILGENIHHYFENFDWQNFHAVPSTDEIKEKVRQYYIDNPKNPEKSIALSDLDIANNYLIVQVTVKYIEEYLKYHYEHLNEIGKVIATEQSIEQTVKFSNTPKDITLYGIVDRINNNNGQITIFDYKTGSVEDYACSTTLDKITEKPKAFQLLFYAYLYRLQTQTTDLQAQIISLRNVNKKYALSIDKQTIINEETFNEFYQILDNIFSEIFDIKKPFEMTSKKSNCLFCPYATMCNRETKSNY